MLKVLPGFWLGAAGDATQRHERVQEEKHLKGGEASSFCIIVKYYSLSYRHKEILKYSNSHEIISFSPVAIQTL